MASTFGAAFEKLETEVQRSILKSLIERRKLYTRAMRMERVSAQIILLADTPGPGRPTDPSYHHTPFYSTRNSSLWINRLLVEAGINESALLWFNTTLADGSPLDSRIFSNQLRPDSTVICLGGNAERWLLRRALHRAPYHKVHHPQAWKRFHSKERYPLLDLLKAVLDPQFSH